VAVVAWRCVLALDKELLPRLLVMAVCKAGFVET
jgi:hypothetical protein